MADPFSFAIATVAQIGVSYAFPSEGPRIKDMKVSASTYGASIPWVFGLCRVPGNMIWGTQPKEHKKKKWQGKGGYYNQYTYTCTFAMGLCRGPISGILRIWADSKLIYDVTAGKSGGDLKSLMTAALTGRNTAQNKYKMRFYLGEEDQLPDSAIIANKGAANAPAFRGLAYILFDDMLLTDFGNRIPQITAEVYVGTTIQSVQAAPFLQSDDLTPIATDYVAGEGGFDFDRNMAYLRYGTELSLINLKTSNEIQRFDNTNFRFPDDENLAKLYCVGRDSSVYVTYGPSAAYMPIARLDAYSMQALGTFGATEDSTGSGNLSTQFVSPVAIATAYSDQSVEYLMAVGSRGELGVLRCSNFEYQWGENSYLGGSAATGKTYRIVGSDPDTSGNPTFYVAAGTSTQITLTKITGQTQEVVQTINGSSLSLGSILWDASVPGVLMFWSQGSTKYLSKWSFDTETEAWRKSVPGYPTRMSEQSRTLTGRFAWVTAGHLYIIDTATGAYTDDIVDPATGEVTPGSGSGYELPDDYEGESSAFQVFDSSRSMLNCFDGIEATVYLNSASVGVTVGTVVDRLLQEGDLERSQYDLTAINAMSIRGYGWASGTDVKGVIAELQRIYLFDLVERDGQLVAVQRGDLGTTNGIETLPQDVLGSSSEDSNDYWVETRTQEAEVPGSIQLTFMNYNDDYQSSVARSQRITNPYPTMYSRQQVAIEANLVLTPSEAKAQTRKMLYSQWGERVQHTTRLPWAYLNLDPADVIEVEFNDGRSYKDRIQSMEFGADFSSQVSTYSQDSGAYDGWTGIEADGGGTGTQLLPAPSIGIPFIINTPLLRDQDDTGGSTSRYYDGIGSGSGDGFTGGGLYRSINNIDFNLLNGADEAVEWGTVIGLMPRPISTPFALDWRTRLTILPATSDFELESITDDELWAGGNPCLVGDEVIQFRDAVENDDGTWTIWNLLRGRRGTEYACDNHVAGERFVFLNNATIGLESDTTNARGQARFFKAVGAGRSMGETPTYQMTYEPRDLMPYAPVWIMREFTTSDDIDITWARRTRLGGNLMDGTGNVALAEASEKYQVFILDASFDGDLSRGNPPTSYRRMYETTTPAASYSAADQATDGFDPQVDTLYLAIYQLSDVVGRGFPGVRDIAPDEVFEVFYG